MRHATEGELHAYLDGALAAIDGRAAEELTAHLSRCADCRALLEEERAIRDRAGELLGAALPGVEAPPFETIVGSADGRATRRVTGERLAWAAGIFVALGAGWMGNALMREPTEVLAPREVSVAQIEPAAESEVSRGVESGADAANERIAGPDDVAGALEFEDRAEDRPVAAPAAPEPQASLEEATPDPAEGRGRSDALQKDLRAEVEADQVGREGEARDTAAKSADEAAAAGTLDQIRAGERQERAVGQASGAEAAGEREQVDVTLPSPPEAAEPFESRRVEALTITASDRDVMLAGVEWRTIDESEAIGILGRPPLRVPDLDVVALQAGGSGFIRVLQRLPSGDQVEVVQWLAGSDPGAQDVAEDLPREAPAAARARTNVPVETRNLVDGMVVTLRAALAPDSLRALASRVR
ncbi:MAG: zf-HC2 domain-containing protein [Gemmatimonadota bacterium]|nr:zf-HC2 domain-containing protein [Gemmatimonadota bacterium]